MSKFNLNLNDVKSPARGPNLSLSNQTNPGMRVSAFDKILSVDRSPAGGPHVTLSHQSTLYDGNVHRLDGSASVSKSFVPTGPTTVGGQLNYTHVPSGEASRERSCFSMSFVTGSSASLGAQHTPHVGTNVSAVGNVNVYTSPDGSATLGVNGQYHRQRAFHKTGKPGYGASVAFEKRL